MRLRNLFYVCGDLERSRRFYERLGLKLLREGSRSRVYEMGAVELHLHAPLSAEEEALYGVGCAGPAPGQVLCLLTTDLATQAMNFDPQNIRLAPREAPWGGQMMLLVDPDGRLVELSTAP